MAKRVLITVAALIVVVGALGFIKYRQIRAAIAANANFQMPPESVTTVTAVTSEWEGSQSAIGTVVAARGVTVAADLPGIVQEIAFNSGARVGAGQVLVRLDVSQERAQLAAAEARQDLTRLDLERATNLKAKNVISQQEFERLQAEAKAADAAVAEVQAIIDRKTIRAPFGGVLGIRQVNLGQYLSGGDPVVPLQAADPIYVNFGLPQQIVANLKVGTSVQVMLEGVEGIAATGKITAINSIIDPATRNVEIQATFENSKGVLRPGAFVDVHVMSEGMASVIALPATAINYAPYGNSIFIVEEMDGPDGQKYKGVRQQFVKLGAGRGDQIAVLDGVTAGQEIVSSGVFKLRPGAAVVVNNTVTPANSPTPSPEDS